METVSVFEAKNKLSALISNVEKNDANYLICRNGKPVAEIVAHKAKDRLKPKQALHVKIKDQLFDDDMSEDWECLH